MMKFLKFFKKNNGIKYILSDQVIQKTTDVLQEYASIETSHEGLVYWCGSITSREAKITAVIAPKTSSNYGRVSTSHSSNFEFIKELNKRGLVYIAQVHSHPTDWVDHSDGDNYWAPFRSEGLVSIVVPNFGTTGMIPLQKCGVHRFENGSFHRLSNKDVKQSFKIHSKKDFEFVELRK